MESRSRRERREALRRADLAEAARLGREFGLGGDPEAVRVRVPQTPTGLHLQMVLLISCLIFSTGMLVPSLVFSAWPGIFILGLLTPAAGARLWLLARHARSLVIWHRIYRYPGGIIQMVSGEPEPRVLPWAAVDTVTLLFYEPVAEDDSSKFLCFCRLEGSATTIDVGGASGLAYPEGVIHDVARDAERYLAPRIAGLLVSRYQAGEPVIAGHWGIEQAGVISDYYDRWKSRLIPWGDVREISISTVRRRGYTSPPDEVTLRIRHKRLWHKLNLSGIPNGMFLPHLFEYIAEQHGLPLWKDN